MALTLVCLQALDRFTGYEIHHLHSSAITPTNSNLSTFGKYTLLDEASSGCEREGR